MEIFNAKKIFKFLTEKQFRQVLKSQFNINYSWTPFLWLDFH